MQYHQGRRQPPPGNRQDSQWTPDSQPSRSETITLSELLAVARRYWLSSLLCMLLRIGAAIAYLAQSFRAGHDYSINTPDATTLDELEVTAHTYRQLFESFLNAYTASVLRKSYPFPDARIITDATPPLEPSHPRSNLVLAIGGLLGAIAAFGMVLVRHGLYRGVTRSGDISMLSASDSFRR